MLGERSGGGRAGSLEGDGEGARSIGDEREVARKGKLKGKGSE